MNPETFGDGLYRVISSFFAQGSSDLVEQHFVDAVRTIFDASAVWFVECTVETETLSVVAHSGLRDGWTPRRWKLDVGQGIGGQVSLSGEPTVIPDYQRDSRRAPGVTQSLIQDEELSSAIVLPVIDEGKLPCSVLYIAHKDPEWFDEDIIGVGMRLASLLALARRNFAERDDELATLAATSRAHEDIMDRLVRLSRLTVVSHTPASLADTVGRIGAVLGGNLCVTDACGVTLVGPPSRVEGAEEWAVETEGVFLGSVFGRGMSLTSDTRLQEAAVNLVGALLLKRRADCEVLIRESNAVGDLLTGGSMDPAVVDGAQRLWGRGDGARMVVLVGGVEATGSGLELDRCLALAEGFATAFGSCVLTGYDHGVASYVIDGLASLVVASRVREVLSHIGIPGTAAAIGTTFFGWAEYAGAYRAAQRALNGVVHSKDEFDVHLSPAEPRGLPLLAQVAQSQDSRQVVREQLAGLLRLGDRGQELIATLSVYFSSGMNLRLAADVLHVHVNTLSARLKRIESELGINLNNGTERFHLELVVRIFVAFGRSDLETD